MKKNKIPPFCKGGTKGKFARILCQLTIIAFLFMLLPAAPDTSTLVTPQAARAANKPVAQAAAAKASPIQAGAQRLMTNIQNWAAKEASALIGNTQTAVKNEIKRRLSRQFKNIEAPIDRTVGVTKKMIAARYNSAVSTIKNIYKKALQKFDK